ncbi:PilZ domain-containing protein [Pelotalea chapellei]|uniref:PilZ domain-containing protein n=1 Tax=Pelotalea chapellei TaxID=44671 RepID=A0ABS5U8R4_9BACT|nr:PilZ domain-containing protein [Pelotalea chapellei]MBT1072060.1 PilZ domain-containing protein [Pelotalea chapellei]
MPTRKFSRVDFKINTSISTANRIFTAEVQNLSMNGMFIKTSEHLTIDEAVDITMTLTGSYPEISLGFQGKVCRITEVGVGFHFEKIDLDSYTHLKNIIAYNIDDSEKVMEEVYNSIDHKLVP